MILLVIPNVYLGTLYPAGAHDRRCAAGRQRHPCAAARRFPVPGHPAARCGVPAAVHAAAVAAAEEEIKVFSNAKEVLCVNSWTSGAIMMLRWLGVT